MNGDVTPEAAPVPAAPQSARRRRRRRLAVLVLGVAIALVLMLWLAWGLPTTPLEVDSPPPLVILTTDASEDGAFSLGSFRITNDRDSPARLAVGERSCGCLSIRAMQDQLAPGETISVELLAELDGVGRWVFESIKTRIPLRREVERLSAVRVEPPAVTFEHTTGEATRDVVVYYRYRSAYERAVPNPQLVLQSPYVQTIETRRAEQRVLADGVWEAKWVVSLADSGQEANHAAGGSELSVEKGDWLIEDEGGCISRPVYFSRKFYGIRVTPSLSRLSVGSPREVILSSRSNNAFRIVGCECPEGVTCDLSAEEIRKIHSLRLTVDESAACGDCTLRVTTTDLTSPIVVVPLLIDSRGEATERE